MLESEEQDTVLKPCPRPQTSAKEATPPPPSARLLSSSQTLSKEIINCICLSHTSKNIQVEFCGNTFEVKLTIEITNPILVLTKLVVLCKEPEMFSIHKSFKTEQL